MTTLDADELIARVAQWSRRDDRVIAAAVCGSHVRGDARPDSDIDFCIVAPDPDALLDDLSWVTALGPGAHVPGAVEDYKLVRSIRAFYGATEAEFGIAYQAWMELPIDRETAVVMNDGLRILYDPDGRLETALASAASSCR